jgi:hypothetical protein
MTDSGSENQASGGRIPVFATTHWSVVRQAGQEETAAGFAALEKLCRTAVGNQFTIINNDGADAVTGTFANLPQNKKLYLGQELFQISYTGGTGNDVVLTRLITPPPPTLTIERISPASVRLLWPTNDPAFRLQFHTNLVTTHWISAAPQPTLIGTNHVVTNAISGAEKYYRLVNP